MIETARSSAEAVADALDPYLDAGYDVVAIEPSDLAAFRREYDRLLSADEADRIASASFEVMEYVYGLLENGADAHALDGDGGPIAYHSHCQQRTLGLEGHTEAVLDRYGYDVVTSDVECCGMAGSFGYKSEYYELSVEVGESLAEQFESGDAAGRPILASGTSCQEQLGDLCGADVAHPIELIAPR